MTSDFAPVAASDVPPLVRRFLQMVARPDLRAEYPDQYEKHWENKGYSGTVRIVQFRLRDQPCELTFSLFFSGDEVIQTGIVLKYQNEALLNEVQKGDPLGYMKNKRIDPIAFLKTNYPNAGPGLPSESQSFALEVDDDSEPEVLRAVMQLTGKSEIELQHIWNHLLITNEQRPGIHRVSPIIKTWLKKERDRLDMQYLRFADLLQVRSTDVLEFTAGGHSCVVVSKRVAGRQIRANADAAEAEWWGGAFYGLNQGELVKVPHDARDRSLVLDGLDPSYEYPMEEIFIDNRQIYAVLFVGEEALVWRTLHQVAPDHSVPMPEIEPQAVDRGPQGEAPAEVELLTEPAAPQAHPFLVAKAEKAYMLALKKRTPELKSLRKEFIKLLYESDPRRFAMSMQDLCKEVNGAAEQALGRDAGAIQREATLVEAYVIVFFDEIA